MTADPRILSALRMLERARRMLDEATSIRGHEARLEVEAALGVLRLPDAAEPPMAKHVPDWDDDARPLPVATSLRQAGVLTCDRDDHLHGVLCFSARPVRMGECDDCGDPAPIGLYQCEVCRRHAQFDDNPEPERD